MKRIFILTIAILALASPLAGAEIESAKYHDLIAGISRAREPVVAGRYVVFTARGKARHAGIAFEHEKYRTIHTFQRLVRTDENNEPRKDDSGKPLETVLFYIAEIPPQTAALHYRLVIDGLWTADPLNPDSYYDYDNGMTVSSTTVEYYETFKTANVNKGQVRFACEASPGAAITVAGTFNNWDPFMYEMTETKAGWYELAMPLPAGTWYYAYFSGTEQIPDSLNPDRVYTKDGRVASVIEVR